MEDIDEATPVMHTAQKVKDQHYLPRFYLRKFSRNRLRLYAFDKVTQKSFQTSVDNIGHERYFYDLPPESVPPEMNGDVQRAEKLLQKYDNEHAIFLQRFLQSVETMGIRSKDKSELVPFVVLQFMRTRAMRDMLNEMRSGVKVTTTMSLRNTAPPELTDAQIERYIEDQTHDPMPESASYFISLFDMDAAIFIRNILVQHIWFVVFNETEIPFYTSDNPVVRMGHTRFDGLPNVGFTAPGLEIIFPLSSKHLLIIRERSFHKADEGLDGGCVSTDEDGVRRCNEVQVARSRRRVICQDDMFDLAKQYCQSHPMICDPNRPRAFFKMSGSSVLLHPIE